MESPKVDEDTFKDIFWLQVLGDHMRIFLGTFDAEEESWLTLARELRDEADAQLNKARANKLKHELALQITRKIREYKLDILAYRMKNEVKLNLPPFFPSHMLNELEEYLKILTNGETSTILEQHKLWLNDAAGHVDSLIADLDITEGLLKKKLKKLMTAFQYLNKSTLETIGFERGGEVPDEWYHRISRQAREQIDKFVEQLEEMEELQSNNALMSRIPKLVLDHMQREEAYYLAQILLSLGAPREQINEARARAIAPRSE